jgi:hypothetical protein
MPTPAAQPFTPAGPWRAFFVATLLLGGSAWAAAPASAPPPLSQIGKPDAAEATRILEQFRRSGIPGEYYLEFELHELPRRGDERVFLGRLWGGRNADAAITRIELKDAAGAVHRLLVQNGEHGAAWRLVNGRIAALKPAELFEPLIPGVEITAFDVQMPFLYWPDASLQSISRSVRSRPAYAYVFRAPADFAAQHADAAMARAYLDTQTNVLLQSELLNAQGKVTKTFAIADLKRMGDDWIPIGLDYRNDVTRDKTHLQVTAAGLRLELAPSLFAPAGLTEDIPAPARVVRVEP